MTIKLGENIAALAVGDVLVDSAYLGAVKVYPEIEEPETPGGLPEGISTTLSENSWEIISQVSKAGYASTYWSIGDEIIIILSTGETLNMQIYDFDHDDLADGSGKAGITFGTKNLMAATRVMNSTSSNKGSFTGSAMYSYLSGDLFFDVNDEVGGRIVSVTKKTAEGGGTSNLLTETMDIFMFSQIECTGAALTSLAGEGFLYPIFSDNASRIKKLSNGNNAASVWWNRSARPTSAYSTYFTAISATGIASYSTSNSLRGVCFGFCV
jgi:Family of unknown function (DUF6273)